MIVRCLLLVHVCMYYIQYCHTIQYILHTIRITYNTYYIQYVLHTICITYNTETHWTLYTCSSMVVAHVCTWTEHALVSLISYTCTCRLPGGFVGSGIVRGQWDTPGNLKEGEVGREEGGGEGGRGKEGVRVGERREERREGGREGGRQGGKGVVYKQTLYVSDRSTGWSGRHHWLVFTVISNLTHCHTILQHTA